MHGFSEDFEPEFEFGNAVTAVLVERKKSRRELMRDVVGCIAQIAWSLGVSVKR